MTPGRCRGCRLCGVIRSMEQKTKKRDQTVSGNAAGGGRGKSRSSRSARARKRKRKRIIRRAAVLFSVLVLTFFAVALIILGFYGKKHFYKGTIINGIDASNMTVDEFESRMREYSLVVTERRADGKYITETITGDAIGVKVSNADDLDGVLKQQKVLSAFASLFSDKTREYEVSGLYGYSDEALMNAVSKLKCLQQDFVKAPADAALSEYDPLMGFLVTLQEEGNQLDEVKARQVIREAVDALLTEVDLDQEDCYLHPQVYADDPILNRLSQNSQKYAQIRITYSFGDEQEVIDGNVLCDWLTMDYETGDVTLNEDRVNEFVSALKKKYDTIFGKRTLHTSYGQDVTVSGGDYGWWMDVNTEQQQLLEMLKNGESGERTPVYFQTAASYGDADWGDTYVEVNLTAQHLFLYVDGVRVLDSDVVSGNESRGFNTPEGTYGITYKERNAMLVGENYETPVSYWMPFNNNIGLHDAVWRDSFGGDIYKKSGSHGCVNLPYNVAKQIYSNVDKGLPVFCYHLPGTESGHLTEQTSADQARAVIDAIDAIGQVDKDSEKKITRARQLYREAKEEARECVTNYQTLTDAEAAFSQLAH